MRKTVIFLVYSFLFVLLFVIVLLLIKGKDKYLEPETIIQNMFNTYSRLSDYQDSGIIKQTSIINGEEVKKESTYVCTYKKSGYFHFVLEEEIASIKQKNIFWSDEQTAFHYKGLLNQYQRVESVVEAISDHMLYETVFVPLLLYKKVEKFGKLKYFSMIGREPVADSICYILKSTWFDFITYRFWIDEKSFLLKKVQFDSKTSNKFLKSSPLKKVYKKTRTSKIPETSFNTVVTINIKSINQTLPTNILTFTPPDDAFLVDKWDYSNMEERIRERLRKKDKKTE